MNMESKDLLEKYGIKPKQELDQHFLFDKHIIRKIVLLARIKKTDVVFEVGAGIGTITKRIPKCEKVFAVEKDKQLANVLRQELKHKPYVEVIEGDALKEMSRRVFTKIISSTPYSICEPLLQKLFVADFERASIVFPERFVERLLSKKTKLGFIVNEFLRIDVEGKIEMEAFIPQPKVGSVITVITKKKTVEKKTKKGESSKPSKPSIIKDLYLQRDKKLKNALRNIFEKKGLTKRQAKDRVNGLGFEEKILEKLVDKLTLEEYKMVLDKVWCLITLT